MRILIVTQKVDRNDSVLGFFHRWIEEFAIHCESVVVICLEKGGHNLPSHVQVLSLGKEKKTSTFIYIYRFYSYIWKHRKEYDAVFVHMNPEYAILGSLIWRCLGKKTTLWYTHKHVDAKLKIAEKFVHTIFTASERSFRLPSSKVHVMGHGIDTDVFHPDISLSPRDKSILSVARISSTKRQLDLVQVFYNIYQKNPTYILQIIGSPITAEDHIYLKEIRTYIETHNLHCAVQLLGGKKNSELPRYYQNASVVVNLSTTGSVDKEILEAISCGTLVCTTNEAFETIFPPEMFCSSQDIQIIARCVERLLHLSQEETEHMKKQLRKKVVSDHDLSRLVRNILSYIES